VSSYRSSAATAMKAQRARQLSGQPTYGFFGDVFRTVGGIATKLIPGQLDDAVFGAIAGQTGRTNVSARSDCPPGFRANPRTGACEVAGLTGKIQRTLPGGQTGVLPTHLGADFETVMGAFGQPAVIPAQENRPTLKCPPNMVLGIDNLCYSKGNVGKYRKHKPGKKPPISVKDWEAMKAQERVRAKAKDIASKSGFTCKRR